MLTDLQRIMQIRIGGGVERCHTVKHQGSYRVDGHTWGVLVILYVLWPGDFARLAAHVLFHDVPEAWIGDAPAPVKKYDTTVKSVYDRMEEKLLTHLNLPNVDNLNEEDREKVSVCDRLELYIWALEQVQSGNKHAACIVDTLEDFFRITPLPAIAGAFLSELRNGSVEHNLRPGYALLFPQD